MSQKMIIGLVGNQNAGKTTLFNALTGQNATVGNWPGVTIERKEGFIRGSKEKDLLLVDTPGVYSLSPYTSEEKVTRSFCLDSNPDLIVNIVDATALERSLYLTTQLMELDCDVIVAMNMADILEKKGISIDFKKLEEELGVSVVRISAKTGEGIDKLISLIRERKYLKNPRKQIFASDIEKELTHLQGDLSHELEDKRELRFSAVKLFENDPFYQALNNDSTKKEISELEKKYDMDAEQIIADQRYQFVTKIKQDCCFQKDMPESLTDKLDKIVLNRYLALPLFLLVIGLMYFLSVGVIGSITSDFIDALFNGSETIDIFTVPFKIEGLGPLLGRMIENAGGSVWASDLVANGIIGGISTVLSFIPQLVTLFICLSVLEASGYMSRIAFFLDALFKKFGLSGKSIIPFIVGTGCSVPGIMTARTVEDPKEKEMTAMLVPFIPCNAKLPIMSLLASVIFPKAGWFVTFFCYLFSIVIILLASLILKKFFYRKGSDSFISELPEYKLPNAYYVYRDARDKTLDFLERAGTTIFLCTFLVWFFTRFTWTFEYVGPKDSFSNIASMNISASILASVGKILAYLFIPAFGGHYSWGLTVSALQGLIAKEQVVSSLSVIAGGGNNILSATSPFSFLSTGTANGVLTSLSFLTFNLFSIPCISAVSTLKRELGSSKKLIFTMSMELTIAYLISTIIGTIGWACNGFMEVSGL